MKQTMKYETDFTFPFGYSKDSDTISVEISCLPHFGHYRDNIIIKSKTTGREVTFKFVDCDYDASGEDVYGFNYVSIDPVINSKLLVIND